MIDIVAIIKYNYWVLSLLYFTLQYNSKIHLLR